MTRFARAKGSKASNERLENESTPWHVMKQQLGESLNKDKPEEKRTKTARQLLQEKEISTPLKSDWAEFEKPKVTKNTSNFKTSSKIEKPEKKIKKNKLKESFQKQKENNIDLVENVSERIKAKKPVLDKSEIVEKVNAKDKKSESQIELSQETSFVRKKKKFNKKKDGNEVEVPNKKKKTNIILEKSEKSVINSLPVGEETKVKPTEKLSKRQKRNLKKKNQNLEIKNNEAEKKNSETPNKKPSNSGFDTAETVSNKDIQFANNTKNEKKFGPVTPGANNFARVSKNLNQLNQEKFGKPNMKNHHLRKPKARDDNEHQRRKPIKSTKLMINGMEIEVVMYDGFPIQKEEAERLKELKQKMILKGIPKSEINAAMKLERRKAEKSLARIRKQVCFHCRKAGHNLSDCPELGMEESATGICFKCGSTEHTHFECKVTKSDDYRFATCFICREAGHIAKQCPDNPRGLYPKGGGCKICGDVTHLQKDCRDRMREKEESTITVKTIAETALESLEGEEKKTETKKEPEKKIVKF